VGCPYGPRQGCKENLSSQVESFQASIDFSYDKISFSWLFTKPAKFRIPNPGRQRMDISKAIAEMKKRPDFTENVGMILIHNGTVRGWSRSDHANITGLETIVDTQKIEQLRREYLERPGIYDIMIEARSGQFLPGDDLLFILVAGDIRENIKPVLADLLDRIKAEAITKKEIKA
jgi:molybdopterin synthase catalytic subunit